MQHPQFMIANRPVGPEHPPLVIAEIGINHEGSFSKALAMVDAALNVGCECVKFQSHIIEDEMIPNNVIPGNAKESIWDIMDRCSLTTDEEARLKEYVESKGMIFLSTPFSRAAADHLETLDVPAYKIGSGECNNYPLVKHIASFKKPIILSTGMNDLKSIARSVQIMEDAGIDYALMHCTSMYPTPYEKIRLRALDQLAEQFPKAVLGLSDHSLSNYPCLGAVARGASLLERHYTDDKSLPGPDIEISMDPAELQELIEGSRILHQCMGQKEGILAEEQPTIDFAYACVVAIADIAPGESLSEKNIWVKRPGTGPIKAKDFETLLGRSAKRQIPKDHQLDWDDFE